MFKGHKLACSTEHLGSGIRVSGQLSSANMRLSFGDFLSFLTAVTQAMVTALASASPHDVDPEHKEVYSDHPPDSTSSTDLLPRCS